MRKPIVSKTPVWKAVALVAGMGFAMLSYPVHAATASGGDTVQDLYDALLSTMKNGRTLGQNGRFTQLEPIIRRTFDIASMVRLSGRLVLGLSDRRSASANGGELWTLYLGNLCRPVRQLCRAEAAERCSRGRRRLGKCL